MHCLVHFLLLMFLAGHALCELTITAMSYDQENDRLAIVATFPGKCLLHDLSLTKKKRTDAQYHFQLSVSNQQDPCNALQEKHAQFSMADVLNRPAEILVHAGTSSYPARTLKIPAYPHATITKITRQSASILRAHISALGKIDSHRFYIDIAKDCSGRVPTCEAFIRDKLGFKNTHGKITTQSIDLATTHLVFRPVTLVFRLANGSLSRTQLQ